MKTIQVQVPNNIGNNLTDLKREQWLQLLREYRQNAEDITLVKEEMKKENNGISLSDYLSDVESNITK